MSKILGRKENFRVVIEPRKLGDMGFVRTSDRFLYGDSPDAQKRIEADYEEQCREIVAEVKRHVDNVAAAYVEYDKEFACEYCGSEWSERSNTYNGGCCSKDEDAEDARRSAAGAPP